ncbi:MAG: glycosyltransferase family 2 protein [Candidatus Micrarchaeia archaeon]
MAYNNLRAGKKIAVVIPAFNEENTIASVISQVPRSIQGITSVEVIVIDDGSTDSTAKKAKDAGADIIVTHKKRKGLAASFSDGIEKALDEDSDIIVNIDADAQYDPSEIPKLIQPIISGEADVVLGVRSGEGITHMPLSKKIGNKIATAVISLLCQHRIRDAQTGFRAFSKEAATMLNILSDFTYTHEMLIILIKKKMKILELDINFKPRQGKSRLVESVFDYALRAGVTILRTYMFYHPLRLFLVLGCLFFAFAAITPLLLLYQQPKITELLIYLVLMAMLVGAGLEIIAIGILADMIRYERELLDKIIRMMRKNE